jgi:hypothetical protein
MSATVITPPVPDRSAADHPAPADRDRGTGRSWRWRLVEALAYAGAPVDPTAALTALRLARLRDQELRGGR